MVPDPRPENYQIIATEGIGRCLVVVVKYFDCKDYDGRKLLLYDNVTLSQLRAQRVLDPHFVDGGPYRSPIARFPPTAKGHAMARILAHALELQGL